MKIKPGLYLCKVPGKNWGLHCVDMDVSIYLALKSAVLCGDFEGLNPFLQSDSDPLTPFWKQRDNVEHNIPFRHDYLFVEFWTDKQDLILDKAIKFAYHNHIELLLEDF